MIKFRTSGYRSKSLFADISLGIFEGLDNTLWCYAFATVVFAGVMAQFMPLLIVILLCGWALLGIFVAVTSEKQLHIVGLDEQAVVILASIAGLMVAYMGESRVNSNGLATMLTVMSLSSLGVAFFFYVIGHYRLTRLLELMPYPVICGFMAGIGWLLLEAGVGIAVNQPISMELINALKEPDNISKLALFLAGAVTLLLAVTIFRRAWALPVASIGLIIVFYAITASIGLIIVFYAITTFNGQSMQDLVDQGWLFDIPAETGGAIGLLKSLSFSQIDTSFVLSVVPQILTIAFLALLTQSMSLSAMMASGKHDLNTSSEIEDLGAGNVLKTC
jgi:SulP family sulfate permease